MEKKFIFVTFLTTNIFFNLGDARKAKNVVITVAEIVAEIVA